ncbi:MAG TPA: hypothetical protein VKV21_14845 [Solirubrobacteraceae bacterium]|nr:hypothetical protein [Solirubrobacteraceae bacterium]
MLPARSLTDPRPAPPEPTAAAIAAFRRLQTKVGAIMLAHARPDGSLICERLRPGAPSLFYAVSAAGRVSPDPRYDSAARSFAPIPLPVGID